MQNAGLDESQAGIQIAWRNTNNLRYADDTILMAESEEKLKNLLMKVKEVNEKAGLKLNIQKINYTSTKRKKLYTHRGMLFSHKGRKSCPLRQYGWTLRALS